MSFPKTYNLQDEWTDFLKGYSPGDVQKVALKQPGGENIGNVTKLGTGCNNEPHEVSQDITTKRTPNLMRDPGYALNISTKTKILYLDREIDTHATFWAVPVIEYWRPINGVVKKQMKFVSRSLDDVDDIRARLEHVEYFTEYIIRQINSPEARNIRFKDERKITIGMSKKDVMCCRGKQKNAFYNCFAMVLRILYNGTFREVHVKVFKTGKLEIPGVADDSLLDLARSAVISTLSPFVDPALTYDIARPDTDVLINSNFNCGFFIDRDAAHSLLRSPLYDIEAVYDPCSYPGIKCKFYFDTRIGFDIAAQTGKVSVADRSLKVSELSRANSYIEVSFMIFRTGSALIVGNCNERILRFVFAFISNFLAREQSLICGTPTQLFEPKHTRAVRVHKKSITVSV